jgi:hypothetical protein
MLLAMNRDDMKKNGVRVSPVLGKPSDKQAEPVLLQSIGTTNIIKYSGKYYAVPQSLGPIDFHNQIVETMSGVIVTKNMEDILITLKKSST